jgi:hypothetical protein
VPCGVSSASTRQPSFLLASRGARGPEDDEAAPVAQSNSSPSAASSTAPTRAASASRVAGANSGGTTARRTGTTTDTPGSAPSWSASECDATTRSSAGTPNVRSAGRTTRSATSGRSRCRRRGRARAVGGLEQRGSAVADVEEGVRRTWAAARRRGPSGARRGGPPSWRRPRAEGARPPPEREAVRDVPERAGRDDGPCATPTRTGASRHARSAPSVTSTAKARPRRGPRSAAATAARPASMAAVERHRDEAHGIATQPDCPGRGPTGVLAAQAAGPRRARCALARRAAAAVEGVHEAFARARGAGAPRAGRDRRRRTTHAEARVARGGRVDREVADGHRRERRPPRSRPARRPTRKRPKPAAERTTGGDDPVSGTRSATPTSTPAAAARRGTRSARSTRSNPATTSATCAPEIARMWAAPARTNRTRSAGSSAPRSPTSSERRSPASAGPTARVSRAATCRAGG